RMTCRIPLLYTDRGALFAFVIDIVRRPTVTMSRCDAFIPLRQIQPRAIATRWEPRPGAPKC
ncbi:MAG: hypothetical protein ABJC89_20630, partial [Acidobacteriota bacterium]